MHSLNSMVVLTISERSHIWNMLFFSLVWFCSNQCFPHVLFIILKNSLELYLEALELCFYCLPANSVRNILFYQDFKLHTLNHVQWQEPVTYFGNYLLCISNYSLKAHLSKIYPIEIYFTEKFTKIFIAIMTTFFHKTSDRKLDDYSICTFVHCTCKILEMLPIFTIIDNYLFLCLKNCSIQITKFSYINNYLKNIDVNQLSLNSRYTM